MTDSDTTTSDTLTSETPTSGAPPGATSDQPTPPPVATPPPTVVDDAAARRNWASAAHWSAVVTALLGGIAFLGPLVVWLIKRDRDQWVAAHAVESLNFQLTWLAGAVLGGIAAVILTVLTVGFALIVLVPLALVAVVAWFVLPIMGAIAASRAEEFRYPLTVRLITV